MTICKFFLNGYCRFGANCRFEHAEPYYSQGNRQYRDGGGRGDFRKNDNYHWQKGGGGGGGGGANNAEVERIAQAIRDEVIAIENGNMWPLTCFAPIVQNGNLKGWEDYSPEELRYEMWKAYQSNTLDTYEKTIQTLYHSFLEKRKKLKMINHNAMEEIREYLSSSSEMNSSLSSNTTSVFQSTSNVFANSGSSQNFSFASAFANAPSPSQPQTATSNFSFSQAFNNKPSSIFGGQANEPGSIFGGQSSQTSGVFGQNQASQQASAFGQSPQQTSVFGQNQPPQQTPVFGQSQTLQPTSFGQNQSDQSASLFGQNPSSVFGNANSAPAPSIFGNASVTANPQTSSFPSGTNFSQNNGFQQGTTGGVFGQNNIQSGGPFQQNFASNTQQSQFVSSGGNEINQNSTFSSSVNTFPSMPSNAGAPSFSVYSPLNILSKEELSAYEAQTFSFRSLPLNAPPENLCR